MDAYLKAVSNPTAAASFVQSYQASSLVPPNYEPSVVLNTEHFGKFLFALSRQLRPGEEWRTRLRLPHAVSGTSCGHEMVLLLKKDKESKRLTVGLQDPNLTNGLVYLKFPVNSQRDIERIALTHLLAEPKLLPEYLSGNAVSVVTDGRFKHLCTEWAGKYTGSEPEDWLHSLGTGMRFGELDHMRALLRRKPAGYAELLARNSHCVASHVNLAASAGFDQTLSEFAQSTDWASIPGPARAEIAAGRTTTSMSALQIAIFRGHSHAAQECLALLDKAKLPSDVIAQIAAANTVNDGPLAIALDGNHQDATAKFLEWLSQQDLNRQQVVEILQAKRLDGYMGLGLPKTFQNEATIRTLCEGLARFNLNQYELAQILDARLSDGLPILNYSMAYAGGKGVQAYASMLQRLGVQPSIAASLMEAVNGQGSPALHEALRLNQVQAVHEWGHALQKLNLPETELMRLVKASDSNGLLGVHAALFAGHAPVTREYQAMLERLNLGKEARSELAATLQLILESIRSWPGALGTESLAAHQELITSLQRP